jgi:SLT domain-containing protein
MTEHMPTRPYFVANWNDKAALAEELAELDRQLAVGSDRGSPALPLLEQRRLARRDELKGIIAQLESTEQQAAREGAPLVQARLARVSECGRPQWTGADPATSRKAAEPPVLSAEKQVFMPIKAPPR